MEAEKLFDVSVPDQLAAKTETVAQFAELLYELRAKSALPLPYDEVLFSFDK
ncbi:hypothetical protein [Methyloglobulus sp.]|uniref:hypothetical protein n=1 Tax=Methyloglobulus sp. TaxID=2518622 RepID=UPI0039896826